MAELTIDPASIRKALDDFVSSYKPSDTPTQEVGYVATAGDGIAHVTGLPGCMANELLTFEDGTLGLAFNLDAREIGVVILGDFAGIEVKQSLEDAGAMEYTTIVASPAADSAGFKYIAPYTGSAIGQHWMYNGKHVLIVFDDLSKQAEAYRSISLLLRRPPGREAYPGDVFYLHSRLLERCAKVSDDLGGGSMTGLPIVETKANDVSAYIPTNVISITDGQIFLQSDLFNANQRPAVDVGISVSRVGGAAQTKALKKVSGTLKISLAQYRSLESFAMFASDLDAASKAQLTRGAHLTELLKQPQFHPYSPEQEVVSVWTGTHGKLDDLDLKDVLPFEQGLLDYIDHNTDILKTIRETEEFTADTEAALDKAVDEFRSTFVSSAGKPLVEKKPDVDKAAPVDQEKIVAGEK